MVNTKTRYPLKAFIRDLWHFLEGNRSKYVFFVFLRAISELAPFALAYTLGLTIDFFTYYEKGQPLTTFYILVAINGFLGALQVWTRMYAKLQCSVIGAKTRQKVRELSISKLMDLELEWHEKEGSGSKIQKINQGSGHIYKFFSDYTNNRSVSVLIGIFGSLGIFLFLGWKYSLFSLAYAGIFLATEYYFSRKISVLTDNLNRIAEKVSGKIHESTSNVLSVKALGLRGIFEESTRDHENKYFKMWYSAKKTGNRKEIVIKTFAAVGYALFLLIVGIDFVQGVITLGSILVFAAYFDKLRSSLNEVNGMINDFIDIKSATGRLMTILGRDIFDRESDTLLEIPKNWRKIEFRNVDFSYKRKLVLRNFNLAIQRGEKIGLVGRSGCGKSTLTKILLGLYEVQSGGVYIDGIDIRKFKHSSITNTITAVLQDSEMFDMTLAENIAISSLKKSQGLLVKSIKVSSLEEVIKRMPRGLHTLLGEKGYRVSGGERQRIGIARAFYKNSPIIILDEATSHLDSKTEHVIQEQLEKELEDKTLIVIAHRLSTLKNVDRIIVMENGKIIEQGKFHDLIKNKNGFYQLYKMQNKL
ncbi:MAG: ABC transporter ATP-binding protein [Nanoarchaeota archaeon]|nr:ABC transporter ATP-binding protein [Nanoarchaeota archaeon]